MVGQRSERQQVQGTVRNDNQVSLLGILLHRLKEFSEQRLGELLVFFLRTDLANMPI